MFDNTFCPGVLRLCFFAPYSAKAQSRRGRIETKGIVPYPYVGGIVPHIWKCSAVHAGCDVEAKVLVRLTWTRHLCSWQQRLQPYRVFFLPEGREKTPTFCLYDMYSELRLWKSFDVHNRIQDFPKVRISFCTLFLAHIFVVWIRAWLIGWVSARDVPVVSLDSFSDSFLIPWFSQ